MIVIWGERICGRVDHVPGICHVATRFFHLYYVPLIPLSSWVIVEGSETSSGFGGRKIRMSAKSVLFGWLQAFLVVFGIVNSIWGGILLAEQPQAVNRGADGAFKLALGLMCLAAWLLFRFRPLRAVQERADELRKHLGIASEIAEEQID